MERFVVYPRTLCFVQNGDDVLLLKGAPTKQLYANLYNGVGGHVERGEDVLAALRREVREETGLNIEQPCLRAVIMADEGAGPGVVIFVYTADSASRAVRSSPEGDLVWAQRAHLLEYDLVPDLRQLLPLLFSGDNGIIYGRYGDDGARLSDRG